MTSRASCEDKENKSDHQTNETLGPPNSYPYLYIMKTNMRVFGFIITCLLTACGVSDKPVKVEVKKPKGIIRSTTGQTFKLITLHQGQMGWGIYKLEVDGKQYIYIKDSDGVSITPHEPEEQEED